MQMALKGRFFEQFERNFLITEKFLMRRILQVQILEIWKPKTFCAIVQYI